MVCVHVTIKLVQLTDILMYSQAYYPLTYSRFTQNHKGRRMGVSFTGFYVMRII